MKPTKILSDLKGNPRPKKRALAYLLRELKNAHRIYLIGNGGSSTICSHIAVDYCKFLHIRAHPLTDPAMLSCAANDFGWQKSFMMQLHWYANKGDALIAISSSGASPNILEAVRWASSYDMFVATFSAFKPDNPLRALGHVNFYVNTDKYRVAEITHLAILHELADV